MPLYNRFAEIYARGPYLAYANGMVESLPRLLTQFHIPTSPGRLLDVACGEGTFAVALAKQGWRVTGIDLSPQMLALARERARDAGVTARFQQKDMRRLTYDNEFNLVTCWFDSLNYLLEEDDLLLTFNGIARALKPGGWFIADMNTRIGLIVGWMQQKEYIQQDTPDLMEVHKHSFDYERMIASVHITAFLNKGGGWERIDETHQERAYSLETIKECLRSAGLEVAGMIGSLNDLTPVNAESRRVWLVARNTEKV